MADPLTRPLKAFLEDSSYELKPRLTFSIEIDFLLASAKEVRLDPEWDDSGKRTYEPDPDPGDSRSIYDLSLAPGTDLAENVRHHVAATLEKAKITAEVGKNVDDKWSPNEKRAWIVDRNQTLKAPDQNYDYHQIKIQSPPYYFSQAALQAVKYVCATLANTYRINTNHSCGLQVHVGNPNKGFSTAAIQSFIATVWTFESQLDTIHPDRRRTDITQYPSLYGHSDVIGLPEKSHGPDKTAFGGLEVLAEGVPVERGQSHESEDVVCELAGFLNWASSVRDKRSNRLKKGCYRIGEGSKTVRFREHEATLDPERVSNWITLCVGILEFSDTIDTNYLHRFLLSDMKKHEPKRFKLGEVLRALELPQQAGFYEKFIGDVKRNGEKAELGMLYDVRDYGSV